MKRILVLIAFLVNVSTSYSQQYNIGTYNLRYANASDSTAGNGWGLRYPVIANIIKFNDLDIFGTQEGLYHMLNNLNDSLPGYKWVGVGRDDGKQAGEHSAIFYKTNKFKILKSGNFWMSTITNRPNKGWDAALPRICTWAQFKEIKTGYIFYFFNLHMDHVGVVARRESAKLVLSKIKEMAGQTPAILTGDFNVDQNSDAYKTITDSGLLTDCYTLSPVKLASDNTFNSFNINLKNTGARIDHVFITKGFKVKRYGILTNTFNGHLPSDHYPVVVVLGR